MIVVAGVLFGITVFHFARTIAHTDAVFPASGVHAVTLPAHERRGLYVVEGDPVPQCRVVDGTGSPLFFERLNGDFTYDRWVAVRSFDTGDGRLTFTCTQSFGQEIRIAKIPSARDFARLGILGILLPLGTGGLGLAVLIVTGILWYTRRPGATTGWQPYPPGGPMPPYPPGGPPPYQAGPPYQSYPPGGPPPYQGGPPYQSYPPGGPPYQGRPPYQAGPPGPPEGEEGRSGPPGSTPPG
jgi:hypothetical protein